VPLPADLKRRSLPCRSIQKRPPERARGLAPLRAPNRSVNYTVRFHSSLLVQFHPTMPHTRTIAYFSMEIGLRSEIPTYSGGLGVLAGDTIRSAADLRVPMVAVTLLHRKGYFEQRIDEDGNQHEKPVEWNPEDHLELLPQRVNITIEHRTVHIRAWKFDCKGVSGHVVPVLLLDTDFDDNDPHDRTITHTLYGNGDPYRLRQEAVLGLGGVRMLDELGYTNIQRYHMNEGHSALLTIELLRRKLVLAARKTITEADLDAVREQCVFTTHTPVPAGHDQFHLDLVRNTLTALPEYLYQHEQLCCDGLLNMTYLSLHLSRYVNGVAQRHGEVSRRMFGGYEIDAITNGVHAGEWTSPPFRDLFDRYLPGWELDNNSLRYALQIPTDDIWQAHAVAKRMLLDRASELTGRTFDPDLLTLGFARRATPYKRSDLLFRDIDRLRQIARDGGGLQLVFAGKAHPRDEGGKDMIRRIYEAADELRDEVAIVYLPGYNMELGALMTAGVDVWLNNPQPPMEASGTSGMKAALNGVPSLSILDGWWIEGCIEGVTGWAIGVDQRKLENHDSTEVDAAALYDALEERVMPTYYQRPDDFFSIMRHVIALNGSFFNTQRMVQQYVLKAYRL
jgi:glycogen phosphorylase